MNDNPESTGAAQEPVGTPNPATSQPSPDSPTSGSPSVDDLVRAVLSHPDFQKQTQSVKDKRIADIQKSLEATDGEVARLAQLYGTTPEKIVEGNRQLEYEQNMAWIAEQRQGRAPEPQPQGSGADLGKIADTVLAQLGITYIPKGLDDFLATIKDDNPVAAATKLTAWAMEQKSSTPKPTAADTPPKPGGVTAQGLRAMSAEELGDRMAELQKNPRATKAERADIVAELARRRNI